MICDSKCRCKKSKENNSGFFSQKKVAKIFDNYVHQPPPTVAVA